MNINFRVGIGLLSASLLLTNIYGNTTNYQSPNMQSSGAKKVEPFSVPELPYTQQSAPSTPSNTNNTQPQNSAEFEESENAIGLKDLLKNADKNYNLEAKDIAILQAKASRTGAIGEFAPTLDGSYQLQNINNSIRKQQSQTASAQLNWEIFSGLKTMNKLREKNALYNASIADRADTKEQIMLSIIQSYYSYFSNVSTFSSLMQKITQLNENQKRIQTLYDLGLTTIDNLESIKTEVANTQYSLENIRLEIEKNKLMLELLTNTEIESLKREEMTTPKNASQKRQDIIKLEYQTKSMLYQSKQITYLPTVSIFDTYTWNSLDSISNKDGSLINPFMLMNFPKNQNMIGISVTMRIFDGFSINRQRENVRLAYLQNQKLLAYKQAEQEKDLKVYQKSLEISQSKIDAAKAGLDSALIAFENVKKKYQANILNFTDYLNSLTRKFEAQAQYNASLNEYEVQKAFYIYYSGQSIEEYIK